jgi:hypothetical protein
MKAYSTSIVLILLAFLLASCGANATQTEEAVLSGVYTAVASTLSAQEIFTTPTATPTTFATTTPFSLPPTIPATVVTVQSKVSYSSASTANGCNDAAYVSDVTIPDGTVLGPGEAFVKTWEFQNTGTCDWNENFLITFVSGAEMDGETTELDQDVSAGATGDISVSLIAPDSEGTYTGYWRLADEDGNVFGQSVYVMIVVSEDAATATPTSTTESATSTSTPTSTPENTATFTPSAAPTEIPTQTPIPTETNSA